MGTSRRSLCRRHAADNWRRQAKLRLIEFKGGKCKVCSYDKVRYPRAFVFHHRDPLQKDFGIGGSRRPFAEMVREVEKCDLLCVRCHAEAHDEPFVPERQKLHNAWIKRTPRQRHPSSERRRCPQCKKVFECYTSSSKECCSVKCARRRITRRPPKSRLIRDVTTRSNGRTSWCAIGRKYGVSDSAVRKWARGYDLM